MDKCNIIKSDEELPMKRGQPSNCGGCGAEEKFFLHNIHQRGVFRFLCSNCVLLSFPGLFCPFCIEIFDHGRPPPPHQRLMCYKCPSISHLTCAPSSTQSSSFLCPTCSNPNFSFFRSSHEDSKTLLDRNSTRALVGAAKFSASSMSKAAVIARVEAEMLAKEAILAKNRAKEALEKVAYLSEMEKRDSTQVQPKKKKKKKQQQQQPSNGEGH